MKEPLRVLIIDDEPADRLLVIRALQKEFPTLEAVEVGTQGDFDRAMSNDNYQIVITDYQLSWNNGLELLRLLKGKRPDRPVIMFTSTGTQEVAVEAMKSGLDDYVVKSSRHFVRLPLAVRSALANTESSRQARHYEEALQESESRGRHLAAIIASAEDAIISKTLDGIVTSWNSGAERIFGYTAEEMMGRSIEILIPSNHPNEEPHIMSRIRAGDRIEHYDTQRVRKDGTLIDVSLTVSPIRDESGQIVGASKIARDITERKEAQEQIRRSEERFRIMAQATNDAIWDWNLATDGVQWNDGVSAMFGYSRQEVGPKAEWWVEHIHPADRDRVVAGIHKVVESADSHWHDEYNFQRRDGSYAFVLDRGQVIRDQDGVPVRMIGAMVDITARKRAEEALLEANRIKDQFLATVSHELRTPLNAILGWARLLRTGAKQDTESRDRALEIIERNARTQTQLINDLLDISRIVSGKLRLDVQLVEPAPVVEAAIDTIQPAADAKDIRIEQVLDPKAGPIYADADRLQQIVWNLLSNAIKFTPKHGRVHIRLSKIDSYVEISIRDTGRGIAADFLPHVFEQFEQQEMNTTRSHAGLGLGLSIVKHLTELHGGTVTAFSRGQGTGAMFTLRFPLAPSRSTGFDELPGSQSDDQIECPSSIAKSRLLIVDDEPDTRELLVRILQHCEAEVKACSSAEEALNALKTWHPDVLIADIGMPGMDGYELVRILREGTADEGGQVPAIALTAYARIEDRMKALRAGFQMHVPKPVDQRELIEVIASMLKLAHRLRDKQ